MAEEKKNVEVVVQIHFVIIKNLKDNAGVVYLKTNL
jgi:hypothetical protein